MTIRLTVVAGLALLAATSAEATPARGHLSFVKPKQELVILFSPHRAMSQPSLRSRRLVMVAARRPITEQRTVLPVLARKNGNGFRWLRVRLPGRPNGGTGWIVRKATVSWRTTWHLVVSTSARRVAVYHYGRRVRIFKAVVGRPSTPTPPGEFFVEESIKLSSRAVGAPFALALSARSTVFQEFAGGPGQIAMHGLGNVGGTPGTAVSHGCVRLENGAMRWLVRRVGAGVPVTIAR